MDIQAIFNLIAGVALSVLGWFARAIYGAIRALETDLSAHKVEVAKNYVTKSDLQRIEDKLDQVLYRLPAPK